jgi:hypothetical protein
MKDVWAAIMLGAGGLLAGGDATFAWSRVRIWRRMPVPDFVGDFDETIRRTDIVSTALAVNLGRSLVSVASFALLVLATIV